MDSELNFYLILGLAVLVLLFMIVVLVSLFRLRQRYRLLLRGFGGQDLEPHIAGLVDEISGLRSRILSLEHQQKECETLLDGVVAGVGIVRFSAFENVGGDQSFVIALLDRRGDGVVLTSLYGTNESRFYAKPIKRRTSEYNLSEEEVAAVAKAVQTMQSRKGN